MNDRPTPRTDEAFSRWQDSPSEEESDPWLLASTLERELAEAGKEVARWKNHFIPFAVIHAKTYGRDHYGEGCLHFTHYDLLEAAGARMDDFKRCGAPDAAAAGKEPA